MIVVSVLEREWGALRARALEQAPFGDAIELRLDWIGNPGIEELGELVRAVGKPVVAAVNGPDAHGFFAGGREEKFAVLGAAARGGAAFVDVDWKDARLMGPLPQSCGRIVSRHEGVVEELEQAWVELEATARANDLLKLVANARSGEDGVRVLESLCARSREVIGFASGAAGSFTRVLAPAFGSKWTYAAPARVRGAADGVPSAPGQLRADELRGMWPRAGITRETRVLGVLGRPAVHSLSPRLHGAALRAAGMDAVYVAIEPDDVEALLEACRSPAWSGFSVTAPFKEEAFARASVRDPRSKAAQAANTLVRANDGWSAHNTDVPAIAAVVERALARGGKELAGSRALIVGTGGSARAALVALKSAQVTVAGRDAAARTELAREFRCAAAGLDEIGDGAWDVILHCTPLGSHAHPGESAVDARAIREGTVVVDAVYRPERTPLLIEAGRVGAIAVSGAEWFVRQAALQFELFTGQGCDEGAMRAELERALAGDAE